MSIASHDPLEGAPRQTFRAAQRPGLALVDDRLVLATPAEPAPDAWREAIAGIAAWLEVGFLSLDDQAPGLRQRLKWPRGSGNMTAAPVFAPWLSHACTGFQDPRGTRDLPPARWVASYLWDPCCHSRLLKGAAADVMLVSPHPSACRTDEESAAPLPGMALLQEMIGAAHAEGRCRIAIIGHERSRSVTARQLLAARAALPAGSLDLEVLAIEDALPRMTADPTGWDAIIVAPELRSLVFAMLAQLTGVGGAWPMVWHGKGLVLVCGETATPVAASASIDAALLVQAFALVARNGGKVLAARRLADVWARLRDRGLVTQTRGSPSPYCVQTDDRGVIEELCRTTALTGRPVTAWKAMAADLDDSRAAPLHTPPRLALVAER